MNSSSLRRPTAPLTPNIEDYKQKHKSKSRRKPYSIQPTNPPTPKLHKAQITIKPNIQKLENAMRVQPENVFCHNHPNQIAVHANQNGTFRLCQKCVMSMSQNEDEYDETIQLKKRKGLDDFKGKIKGFGLRLEEATQAHQSWSYQWEQNFYDQKDYISQTFDSLIFLIQQKKRKLIHELMTFQQMVKSSLSSKSQLLDDIKSSIKRYVDDIDSNYDQIIQCLSFDQFLDILNRYNKKISFLEGELQRMDFETTLNVYIPKTEIEKYTQKAAVQLYPMGVLEDANSFKNKTMQRHTTEKNNILADYQLVQNYQTRHQHQSLNNKMGHQRRSRDRNDLIGKETSLGQGRAHANKENFYFENNLH